MNRIIRDKELTVTRALPAQNTNVNSDAIEVGAGVPEGIQVELAVPATPSLADSNTLTFTFQDSADNSSFAAIPELATLVRTGASGAGAAAATRVVYLPPSVRKYVRVNIAASASAGNNTAVSAILSILG